MNKQEESLKKHYEYLDSLVFVRHIRNVPANKKSGWYEWKVELWKDTKGQTIERYTRGIKVTPPPKLEGKIEEQLQLMMEEIKKLNLKIDELKA